jgi:uridine kinase
MIGDNLIIKPEYYENASIIVNALKAKLQPWPAKFVIGIGGESGSGKSVTAQVLKQQLTAQGLNVIVLNQDDYFKLPPQLNHNKRLESINNVGMHEVHLALIENHLFNFKTNALKIAKPLVNFSANIIMQEVINFQNIDCCIIEGTYILQLENLDFRIFIDRNFHDTKAARLSRNRESQSEFLESVLEIEHQIIKQYIGVAHLIIQKDYSILNN